MGIFDGAKSITMNNKVVSSITTDTGVLYQKKVNSQVSIDVPLNLTYSDEFNITGYLTSNGVGIVGATVNLLVGSTVVDFTTTTTGGAYSFTNYPVSTGNHSFQVVFNGNSEYFASESTIVNRVVAKETSVLLNVTPTGKIGFAQTGTGYNSVTPACILRTDDDEAIAYATIHFGDAIDSTQIDGYAQGNDVTYPTTSLNIVYEGDSNYTPSSVLASFEYQIPTLLNLSGTKNIISKDETTTISGVLYDQDGDIIPNCQLEYNIKHNSTIITSGTVRTNNNGAITLNYTGTGAGDITIEVKYGIILQETYEVTDYIRYDDATSDKTSNYQYNNLNSHTFSTDKYIAQRTIGSSPASTYYSPIYPSDTLPTNFEISVDLLAPSEGGDMQFGLCVSDEYTQTYSGTNQCFLYANSNRTALGYRVNGSLTNYGASSSYNANTWYTFKITVNGTSVSTQILNGDTVVQSWSGTLSNIQFWKKIMIITGGQANTIYWKNLKIKAL